MIVQVIAYRASMVVQGYGDTVARGDGWQLVACRR